jgi:hypothetical protein
MQHETGRSACGVSTKADEWLEQRAGGRSRKAGLRT